MPRYMDAGTPGVITQSRVLPAVFVEAHFADGIAYMWNGYGNIDWAGKSWVGLSMPGGECLGSISVITEDSANTAQGITLTLSGIDPTMLAHASNIRQGLPCHIWINFFNDEVALIGSVLVYSGLMDQPTIEDGSDSCKISVSVESRLSDLQRAQTRRWTDQDQRQRYPTDTGFRHVNVLQTWSAVWGG